MHFFEKKRFGFIEDQIGHLDTLITEIATQAPDLLNQSVVFALDKPGPDTTRFITSWCQTWPELLVCSSVSELMADNYHQIDELCFQKQHRLSRFIADRLRPNALVFQDIQLDSLKFISKKDWWESIFLATEIKGRFPQGPPHFNFISNKVGFGIGFGKELMHAGFDPNNVYEKQELKAIPETMNHHLVSFFPSICKFLFANDLGETWIAASEIDDLQFDFTFVRSLARARAAGTRLVNPVECSEQEAQVIEKLIFQAFEMGPGIPTEELGSWLVPNGNKAEKINQAAKLIHQLRKKLGQEIIQTVDRHYRLQDRMNIALVEH